MREEEMTHSPLPWKYEKKDGVQVISDAQGESLFCDEPYDSWCSSEDMPFVVKVANAHEELVQAAKGMLENYIQLKRISLAVARSDNPDWMPSLTEDDDIHVIAIRKAIAKAEDE